MARRNEGLGETLVKAPWWVSVTLGLILTAVAAAYFPPFSPFVFLFFCVTAVLSAYFAHRQRKLVDDQTSLESLRATSWKGFEYLVAEAFRRRGYAVDVMLGGGADGGVDVTLRKDGHKTVVQCKQWKAFKVGASVVRELLGSMTAEKADAGIVITTGKFSSDAVAFARTNFIELIDGSGLLDLVRDVQKHTSPQPSRAPSQSREVESISSTPEGRASIPTCPTCGASMVKRTAKRGVNVGQQFWGCSKYPTCRGTRATG